MLLPGRADGPRIRYAPVYGARRAAPEHVYVYVADRRMGAAGGPAKGDGSGKESPPDDLPLLICDCPPFPDLEIDEEETLYALADRRLREADCLEP